MSESIELRAFRITDDQDGDIEEYHEIREENPVIRVSSLNSGDLPETVNEYDFFIQTTPKPKTNERKKKHKKKHDKTSKLLDTINSELANLIIPINKNVIEFAENGERFSSYWEKFTALSQDRRVYQRKMPCMEPDYGYRRTSKYIKLRPTFPRILESTAVTHQPDIPVEYVHPKTFEDMINEYSESKDNKLTKFIEIEMKNIKFKHHHQYSLENVLVLKLIEKFNEHQDLDITIKDLKKDINISRETKNNLKRELLKASPSKNEHNIRFDETLRKYVDSFLQLKYKYINTIRRHLEAVHTIMSLWSDIEAVREKTGVTYTPYNLITNKYVLSREDYDREWNRVYEVEFSDALDKIEYDYITKYLEYKEIKANSNQNKLSKPKLIINEEDIKKEINNLLNYIAKREVIAFELKIDESMVSKLRKNDYMFEIYVDDLFVCESEQYTSNDPMFNTAFEEVFSIELLPHNKQLAFVLKENNEKMSLVLIDISRSLKNRDNFLKLLFKYNGDIEPNTYHVGSGYTIKEIAAANKIRLKSSGLFIEKLITVCEVNVKISWSYNLEQDNEDSIRESVEISNKLQRILHGIKSPSIEALADIISRIYGIDVTNDENMIETLRAMCRRDKKTDDEFYIDENSSDFVRLKLLHLRSQGGFADIENKRVPINGSQITTEHLNCLQRTKEKDFDMEYLKEKDVNMDPIEMQRFIAMKYIQKLNKKMITNLNEHLMVKTQKDFVRELKDFSFKFVLVIGNNRESSTPLPNSVKQQKLTESLIKEQDIYVTVVRAFNLFDRSTDLFDEENVNDFEIADVPGFKVRPLRPFVRVSYHGVSAQTVSAIGCHPTWNHTLKITTKLEPLSSLHINIYDDCKVNIVEGSDEQATNTVHYRHFNKWLGTAQVPLFTVLSMGTLRGTFKLTSPPIVFGYETHQNKDCTSFIPEITQLLKRNTSYVTLSITTSLSNLGGIQAYNQPLPSSVEDDYVIKFINNFVSEYLNDFPDRNISLTFVDSGGRNKCVTHFLQPIPLPSRDFFPKNPKACGSGLSKSSGVSRSSSSKSSGRKREIDLEANDERESEYSHASWKSGDSLEKLINIAMRYVALVQSYEVTETHTVTLMGLELLKVLFGTPLDHSILLASYFLYLGIKCYIAIGLGLPRGRSSFVLIQYDFSSRRFLTTDHQVVRNRGFMAKNDGLVWYVCDAISGERYELRDVGSPMKTVDYVFDNENIWVNVQSSQDCENMGFDFTKSSDWQPVFDKTIFIMKHPIVNDVTIYSPPGEVELLRQALEGKIRGKVQKWRALKKTIWNRYCCGLLREALCYWEYWAFNQNDTKPGYSQKLRQLMATYKIFGFPLNMPFLNTKSVISAIKSTGLHVDDDPNVEFGLAVEVYGYPNNVLSVWVFFVSIARI